MGPAGIQAMGFLMAFAPVAFIILGGVYSFWNRNRSGRKIDPVSMLTPNDKWCSAIEDANKNRGSGIANVSYVKDEITFNNYLVTVFMYHKAMYAFSDLNLHHKIDPFIY